MDTAQYALFIAKQDVGADGTFRDIVSRAQEFIQTDEAVTVAQDCMEKILNRRDVLFEDVGEVLKRAQHMLSCL